MDALVPLARPRAARAQHVSVCADPVSALWQLRAPMTTETYRKAIAALGLTQEAAGELFGATGRTGHQWPAPPRPGCCT